MTENKAADRNFEPTKPVGVFLMVFGFVVAGAAFIPNLLVILFETLGWHSLAAFFDAPMSFSNKLINLGSGLLLAAIGSGFFFFGAFRRWYLKNHPLQNPAPDEKT